MVIDAIAASVEALQAHVEAGGFVLRDRAVSGVNWAEGKLFMGRLQSNRSTECSPHDRPSPPVWAYGDLPDRELISMEETVAACWCTCNG